MTNKSNHVDSEGFIAQDEIDDLFGNANLNPNRSGCPPQEELAVLARRGRPIDDPGYDHLADCSACYRHVRGLQQASARQDTIKWRDRAKWMAAAAALLVVVGGSVWLYFRTGITSSQPAQTTPPEVAIAKLRVERDLRRYMVSRSPQEQSDRPAVGLPQGWLNLTLLLPVGSEPGAYDLQVLDQASHVMASAPGQAAIRNYITTLDVTIDLRAMAPGAYQLALRRPGEDWHVYPAIVK